MPEESVEFTVGSETAYIVVDGYGGSETSFDVVVNCE